MNQRRAQRAKGCGSCYVHCSLSFHALPGLCGIPVLNGGGRSPAWAQHDRCRLFTLLIIHMAHVRRGVAGQVMASMPGGGIASMPGDVRGCETCALPMFAASSGAASKMMFKENAMRSLSTTVCRGIARQVLASAPLRARLDGQPVLPGKPLCAPHWDALAERILQCPCGVCGMMAGGCCAGGVHPCCACWCYAA